MIAIVLLLILERLKKELDYKRSKKWLVCGIWGKIDLVLLEKKKRQAHALKRTGLPWGALGAPGDALREI
ncbi:MAG: hypothetical protein LBT59_18220 [Clostridiales bacterium]|nr:hypothetical protein [Clostridiales bacterium]